MLAKYGSRATLLFSDTDSLRYHIECDDLERDRLQTMELYDTSNYPMNHRLHSEAKKCKFCLFKDELGGKSAIELCSLKAEM